MMMKTFLPIITILLVSTSCSRSSQEKRIGNPATGIKNEDPKGSEDDSKGSEDDSKGSEDDPKGSEDGPKGSEDDPKGSEDDESGTMPPPDGEIIEYIRLLEAEIRQAEKNSDDYYYDECSSWRAAFEKALSDAKETVSQSYLTKEELMTAIEKLTETRERFGWVRLWEEKITLLEEDYRLIDRVFGHASVVSYESEESENNIKKGIMDVLSEISEALKKKCDLEIEDAERYQENLNDIELSGHLRARNGYCLDIQGDTIKLGAKVDTYFCHPGKTQQWKLTAKGRIKPTGESGTDLCLSLQTVDESLSLQTCSYSFLTLSQEWRHGTIGTIENGHAYHHLESKRGSNFTVNSRWQWATGIQGSSQFARSDFEGLVERLTDFDDRFWHMPLAYPVRPRDMRILKLLGLSIITESFKLMISPLDFVDAVEKVTSAYDDFYVVGSLHSLGASSVSLQGNLHQQSPFDSNGQEVALLEDENGTRWRYQSGKIQLADSGGHVAYCLSVAPLSGENDDFFETYLDSFPQERQRAHVLSLKRCAENGSVLGEFQRFYHVFEDDREYGHMAFFRSPGNLKTFLTIGEKEGLNGIYPVMTDRLSFRQRDTNQYWYWKLFDGLDIPRKVPNWSQIITSETIKHFGIDVSE